MVKRTNKGPTKIKNSGAPKHRSRSLKRVQKVIPGGQTITTYKHKKTAKHKCAICSTTTIGRPRGRPVDIKRKTNTQNKVNRPFGGMLCSKCSRKVISLRAKVKHDQTNKEDIPISLRNYM